MDIRLDGKVAFVTGGARGIGLASAEAFMRAGARVAILDTAAADVLPGPVRDHVCFCRGDVAEEAAVVGAVRAAADTFGGLDIVFNNAGIAASGSLEEIAPADFDRAVAVNLRGPYLVSRCALPLLRARGGGTILMNASNSGLVARHHDPVYGATKAALLQLTRSLALGLARDRIRVNAICPGPVDTDTLHAETTHLDPADALRGYLASVPLGRALGRIATPSEIAQAAVYLCSDAAAYVTGVALPVDGGKTAGLQVGVA